MDRVSLPSTVTLLAQGQRVPRADQLALADARLRERRPHVRTGVGSDQEFAVDPPGDEILAGDPKTPRILAQAGGTRRRRTSCRAAGRALARGRGRWPAVGPVASRARGRTRGYPPVGELGRISGVCSSHAARFRLLNAAAEETAARDRSDGFGSDALGREEVVGGEKARRNSPLHQGARDRQPDEVSGQRDALVRGGDARTIGVGTRGEGRAIAADQEALLDDPGRRRTRGRRCGAR